MYREQFHKDKVWLDHMKITKQLLSNISKAVGFIVGKFINYFLPIRTAELNINVLTFIMNMLRCITPCNILKSCDCQYYVM